jgi:hypothetical protein
MWQGIFCIKSDQLLNKFELELRINYEECVYR